MNTKQVKYVVIINASSDSGKLFEGARYTQKHGQEFLAVFCSSQDWSNPHYIQIEALEQRMEGDTRTNLQYQTLLVPSCNVVAVMQFHDDQISRLGFVQ